MKKYEFDKLILSVGGRGHWLAAQWAHKGYKVGLIDFSHKIQHLNATDQIGPFPYLERDDLPENFWDFWVLNGQRKRQNSFSLSSKEGVFESHSEWSINIAENWKNHEFKDIPIVPNSDQHYQKWLKRNFKSLLSSRFYSNHLVDDSCGFEEEYSPVSVFFPHSRAATNRMEWCRDMGVDVYAEGNWGLNVENEKFVIEDTEKLMSLSGTDWIWTLNPSESRSWVKGVDVHFKGLPIEEPQMRWVRFLYRVEEFSQKTHWPTCHVRTESINLPWWKDHSFFVQYDPEASAVQVWTRWPYWNKMTQEDWKKEGEAFWELIAKRYPWIKLLEWAPPAEDALKSPFGYDVWEDKTSKWSDKFWKYKEHVFLSPFFQKRLDPVGLLMFEKNWLEQDTAQESEV